MGCRAVSSCYSNGPAAVLNHFCVEFGLLAHAPKIRPASVRFQSAAIMTDALEMRMLIPFSAFEK
jgi:hypothetical protein